MLFSLSPIFFQFRIHFVTDCGKVGVDRRTVFFVGSQGDVLDDFRRVGRDHYYPIGYKQRFAYVMRYVDDRFLFCSSILLNNAVRRSVSTIFNPLKDSSTSKISDL